MQQQQCYWQLHAYKATFSSILSWFVITKVFAFRISSSALVWVWTKTIFFPDLSYSAASEPLLQGCGSVSPFCYNSGLVSGLEQINDVLNFPDSAHHSNMRWNERKHTFMRNRRISFGCKPGIYVRDDFENPILYLSRWCHQLGWPTADGAPHARPLSRQHLPPRPWQ